MASAVSPKNNAEANFFASDSLSTSLNLRKHAIAAASRSIGCASSSGGIGRSCGPSNPHSLCDSVYFQAPDGRLAPRGSTCQCPSHICPDSHVPKNRCIFSCSSRFMFIYPLTVKTCFNSVTISTKSF
jgi:hypothetical protein